MKCKQKQCKHEATYDSPSPMCDVHWAKWWSDAFPKKDRSKIYKEVRLHQKRSK